MEGKDCDGHCTAQVRAPSQHGPACRVTRLEARSHPCNVRKAGRPGRPAHLAEEAPGTASGSSEGSVTGTCFPPSRSSSFLEPGADAGGDNKPEDGAARSGRHLHRLHARLSPGTPAGWPCGGPWGAGGRRSGGCARRGTHSQRRTPPGRAARLRLLPRGGWGRDCRPGLCGPAWPGGDPGPPPSAAADRGSTVKPSWTPDTRARCGEHTRALTSWLSL